MNYARVAEELYKTLGFAKEAERFTNAAKFVQDTGVPHVNYRDNADELIRVNISKALIALERALEEAK